MVKKYVLKELLANECVLAPCVFDCASARAVELSGFKAMLLSGAELSMAMNGLPDIGVLTLDELVWAVTRITDTSPLPLAVDIEDGFGNPLSVYRTCKRIAKAGASAVLLEDEADPGFAREIVTDNLLPRKDYYAKVKAALDALAGSECMLIARTNVDPSKNIDEGIERCLGALELGADMTVIIGIDNLKDAAEISRRVPGWKMFADLNAKIGIPEISLDEIYPMGFNFVTMHYLLKAAMAGMLEYGKENFKNQNNIYSNNQKPMGVPGHSGMPFFSPQEWLDFEGKFTGEFRKFRGHLLDQSGNPQDGK